MKRRKPEAPARATLSLRPPARGQVWWADLGEPVGHEQGFARPFLVLSIDAMNEGPSDLIIGVPLSTRDREQPTDIRVEPPEAELTGVCFVQPEFIRCISKERLRKPMGHVRTATLAQVEDVVRILIGL